LRRLVGIGGDFIYPPVKEIPQGFVGQKKGIKVKEFIGDITGQNPVDVAFNKITKDDHIPGVKGIDFLVYFPFHRAFRKTQYPEGRGHKIVDIAFFFGYLRVADNIHFIVIDDGIKVTRIKAFHPYTPEYVEYTTFPGP
jgi:hypothetical protein